MALRYSDGLRNFIAKYGSFADALNGGEIRIYTGAQPSSANAAPTGTLLCVITDSSAARTAEVLSTGTMTLTGGAAGSVDSVTVNSVNILGTAVPFNGTLNQTATDVANQINRNMSNVDYTASASGAVITISAKRGTGTNPNGFTVAGSCTTITASYAAMAGGVASVNGLKFDYASGGVMNAYPNQKWSGNNVADGQAGWWRFTGGVADSGAVDTTGTQIRVDGAVTSTGSELSLSSSSFVNGAETRVVTAQATTPASA